MDVKEVVEICKWLSSETRPHVLFPGPGHLRDREHQVQVLGYDLRVVANWHCCGSRLSHDGWPAPRLSGALSLLVQGDPLFFAILGRPELHRNQITPRQKTLYFLPDSGIRAPDSLTSLLVKNTVPCFVKYGEDTLLTFRAVSRTCGPK